jgi:hypothetical protein
MDDIYQNLPSDPEEAFLVLDDKFREELQTDINRAGENGRHDVCYVDYIAKVIGTLDALDLESEFNTESSSNSEVDFNTHLNSIKTFSIIGPCCPSNVVAAFKGIQ